VPLKTPKSSQKVESEGSPSVEKLDASILRFYLPPPPRPGSDTYEKLITVLIIDGAMRSGNQHLDMKSQ